MGMFAPLAGGFQSGGNTYSGPSTAPDGSAAAMVAPLAAIAAQRARRQGPGPRQADRFARFARRGMFQPSPSPDKNGGFDRYGRAIIPPGTVTGYV